MLQIYTFITAIKPADSSHLFQKKSGHMANFPQHFEIYQSSRLPNRIFFVRSYGHKKSVKKPIKNSVYKITGHTIRILKSINSFRQEFIMAKHSKSRKRTPSSSSSSTTDSTSTTSSRSPTPKRRRKQKTSSSKRHRAARSSSSDTNPPSRSRSRNHNDSRRKTRRSPSPRAPRQPRHSPRPSQHRKFHEHTDRIDVTKVANALSLSNREIQLIKTENWRRKYNSLYSKTRHHEPEKAKLQSAIDVHTKTISGYQETIAEQKSTIAEQRSTIAEQKFTIAEQESTIAELKTTIFALKTAPKADDAFDEKKDIDRGEEPTQRKTKFDFENFDFRKITNNTTTSTPIKKQKTQNIDKEKQLNTDKNNNKSEKRSWVPQKEWVSAIEETLSFNYDDKAAEAKSTDDTARK